MSCFATRRLGAGNFEAVRARGLLRLVVAGVEVAEHARAGVRRENPLEPFGCVVIESMALETPVVGSGSAGIAEQIVHGETGLLFPPGDDRALAAALDLLFAEAATRSRMASRGRQRYLDTFEMEHSYDDRRKALEKVKGIEVAPVVRSAADAEGWLESEEGVIAKQSGEPYRPGERVGMVKIKRVRTADCVVVGWRPGKAEGTLGAVILGMYEGKKLRPVGHASGFSAKEKRELPKKLAPYETGERGSGEPSRWSQGRDLEWIALKPELVVEITFDHVSDGRIRHGAKVQRWRDDKPPRQCTYDQLSD